MLRKLCQIDFYHYNLDTGHHTITVELSLVTEDKYGKPKIIMNLKKHFNFLRLITWSD